MHFSHAAGCSELDSILYNFMNPAFSQAPGTQIVLSCNLDIHPFHGNHVIITTYQENGTWETDPVMACELGD